MVVFFIDPLFSRSSEFRLRVFAETISCEYPRTAPGVSLCHGEPLGPVRTHDLEGWKVFSLATLSLIYRNKYHFEERNSN